MSDTQIRSAFDEIARLCGTHDGSDDSCDKFLAIRFAQKSVAFSPRSGRLIIAQQFTAGTSAWIGFSP